ncbi:MAG: hypothetical protein IAE82_10985 [Opitutaceae bacterium]|nr:hypothetical protein [Opitutaceae bacterium]
MKSIVVIDTCYLLELYKVPGFSSEANFAGVYDKIQTANSTNAQLVVSIPCILEFANHLADASSRGRSLEIAVKFRTHLESSIKEKSPWTIVPAIDSMEELGSAVLDFMQNHLVTGVGLCDVFTIRIARALKNKYAAFGCSVHIFTMDCTLKAHEPDEEKQPFLGCTA